MSSNCFKSIINTRTYNWDTYIFTDNHHAVYDTVTVSYRVFDHRLGDYYKTSIKLYGIYIWMI